MSRYYTSWGFLSRFFNGFSMVCRSLVDAFLNSSPGMFPWTEPGFDGRSDQFPIKSSPEGSAFLTSLSNSLFNRTTDQGCIVHVVLSQVRKCAGLWISRQPVQTIPTDHGMRPGGWRILTRRSDFLTTGRRAGADKRQQVAEPRDRIDRSGWPRNLPTLQLDRLPGGSVQQPGRCILPGCRLRPAGH
jgi:hypothetical protein